MYQENDKRFKSQSGRWAAIQYIIPLLKQSHLALSPRNGRTANFQNGAARRTPFVMRVLLCAHPHRFDIFNNMQSYFFSHNLTNVSTLKLDHFEIHHPQHSSCDKRHSSSGIEVSVVESHRKQGISPSICQLLGADDLSVVQFVCCHSIAHYVS